MVALPPAHLAYKVVGLPNLDMRLDMGRVYTLAQLELRCGPSPSRQRALHLKLADPKMFKPALHSKLAMKLANFDLGPRQPRCPKLPRSPASQACATSVAVPSDRCEEKCQAIMQAPFGNGSAGFSTPPPKQRRIFWGEQGSACSTKWKTGSLHESPVEESCSISCAEHVSAGCVRRGAFVLLHSLRESPEMNGCRGLCLDMAEGDRWAVHLDGQPLGSYYNVRQQNLFVVTGEGGSVTEQHGGICKRDHPIIAMPPATEVPQTSLRIAL